MLFHSSRFDPELSNTCSPCVRAGFFEVLWFLTRWSGIGVNRCSCCALHWTGSAKVTLPFVSNKVQTCYGWKLCNCEDVRTLSGETIRTHLSGMFMSCVLRTKCQKGAALQCKKKNFKHSLGFCSYYVCRQKRRKHKSLSLRFSKTQFLVPKRKFVWGEKTIKLRSYPFGNIIHSPYGDVTSFSGLFGFSSD